MGTGHSAKALAASSKNNVWNWGKTAEKLSRMGIQTIGDLAKQDRNNIVKTSANGEMKSHCTQTGLTALPFSLIRQRK